jgi:hypothetical protein
VAASETTPSANIMRKMITPVAPFTGHFLLLLCRCPVKREKGRADAKRNACAPLNATRTDGDNAPYKAKLATINASTRRAGDML